MLNLFDPEVKRGIVVHCFRCYAQGEVSEPRFDVEWDEQVVASDLTMEQLNALAHQFNDAIHNAIMRESLYSVAMSKYELEQLEERRTAE